MLTYIKIGDSANNNDDFIEVPSEPDNSLLLSSVSAQFPGSVGLRFRSETGSWRGLRVTGNNIDPPPDGWGTRSYYIVKPKTLKRKNDEHKLTTSLEVSAPKQNRDVEENPDAPFLDRYYVPDLMIANLPRVADEEIKEYFEHFGPLDLFTIQRNAQGESRCFGFLQFQTPAATKKVLGMKHFLCNSRLIDVRYTKRALEMLQMGYGLECLPDDQTETKLFVGHLPLNTTQFQLQHILTKYASAVRDIYIPPQGNGRFAFVTFMSCASAFRAMHDTTLQIDGQSLQINLATEKKDPATGNEGNKKAAVGANGRSVLKVEQLNDKSWNMASFLMETMQTISAQNKKDNPLWLYNSTGKEIPTVSAQNKKVNPTLTATGNSTYNPTWPYNSTGETMQPMTAQWLYSSTGKNI